VSHTPQTLSHDLSVVLCTFNGEAFLRPQLESILDQSLLPGEVVIADDASSDHTLEILQEFAERAEAMGITWRIIRRESPLGPAANFWATLREAKGEFVALADQDDVWHTEKLGVLRSRLVDDPRLLLVHSDATLIDRSGRATGSLLDSLRATREEKASLVGGEGLRALLRRNLVTGATVMIRRNLLDRAGELPEGWVHDEWLALVAAAGDGLALEPRELIDYRQHGQNAIGATKTTLSDAIGRLGDDRAAFHARQRSRREGIASLVEGSAGWMSAEHRRALRAKISHQMFRIGLPNGRWRRVVPVFVAWARGDYSRYSRGLFDALRDLSLPPIGARPTHEA